MALPDRYFDLDEAHPIDIAETVAARHAWDFDRLADDQIVMGVEGQWRSYSLMLAWSRQPDTLRLVCSFDMDPPTARHPALYETLNLANDAVWDGGFTYWAAQRLMVWRYGLLLAGDQPPSPDQIERMVLGAVDTCERFYPAFQMTCWGGASPRYALDMALGATFGTA